MHPIALTTNRCMALVGHLGHPDRFNMVVGIIKTIITSSLHDARHD